VVFGLGWRIAVLGTALLLAACSADPQTAEELAERYFAHLAAGDLGAALSLVDPDFLEARRSDGRPLEQLLASARERLGAEQQHRLHEHRRGLTQARDGERHVLVFEVVYANDTAFVELVIDRPHGASPRIARHEIKSPWLSELVPEGEKLARQYLEAVREQRPRDVAKLFAKKLRGSRLRSEVKRLENQQSERGAVSSYELVGAEKHPGRSLENDLVLVFRVEYGSESWTERFWIKRTLKGSIGLVECWSERTDLRFAES
jgi:hypothetical protein